MKYREKKRCPRCGTKVASEMGVCPSCKLNYQKFFSASNKEAKLALKEGEKDRVIYRAGVPTDVSKTKLLLLAIFAGLSGAHLYYVGRKKLGIFYSVFFCVGILYTLMTILLNYDWSSKIGQFLYIFVFVWGAVLMLWVIDVVKICFNTFKVPVSLPRR